MIDSYKTLIIVLVSSLLLPFLLILLDLLRLPPLLGRRLVWPPLERRRRDLRPPLRPAPHFTQVLRDDVLLFEHDVLALPVLNHLQVLHGGHDVARVDAHLLAEGLDGDVAVGVVAHVLQDHLLPVGAIRDQAEVGEGLLGGADLREE